MKLAVEGLSVDVLGKPVLRDVSVELREGEFAATFGHNGAGKTTLLRTILGLWRPRSGRVLFEGRDVTRWPTHQIVRAGIGMVPQLRGYFESLTVEDNLDFARRAGSRIGKEEVFRIFPALRSRRKQLVETMSGGQRQMVAVANALMSGPRLLLLDEPSGGLAPAVVDTLLKALVAINRDFDISVLLVEQDVRRAARVAESVYVLDRGRVAFRGPAAEALKRSVWELI